MLSKDKRLNLKTSFNFVIKGQKLENQLTKIFFRSGDNSQALVGIALKKEHFKLATDRNRARRLISKGFENLYNKLPEGINIVTMPKKEVLSKSSDEVTKSLEEILMKANLLEDK